MVVADGVNPSALYNMTMGLILDCAREFLDSLYSLKIPVDLKMEAEVYLGKDLCVCMSGREGRVSIFLSLGTIPKKKKYICVSSGTFCLEPHLYPFKYTSFESVRTHFFYRVMSAECILHNNKKIVK